MKRCIALLLVLLLALPAISLSEEESKYKTEWDLTELYASVDAWYADCEDALDMLKDMKRRRFRATKTQSGYDQFMEAENAFLEKYSRLEVYTALLFSLDPVNADGMDMSARCTQMTTIYSDIISFIYQADLTTIDALAKVQGQLSSTYSVLIYSEIPALPFAADQENPYAAFLNTYAYLLNAKMSTYSGCAQGIGFSSSLDYALQVEQLPRKAYTLALKENKENMDALHQYFNLHNRGKEQLQEYEETFTYEEAVEDILCGVSYLGEDYVQDMDNFLQSGHVDAMPSA